MVTPGGLSVGFWFTLSTTMTGIGTFSGSSFSPSCLSTASKTLMPSAPAAASAPFAVHFSRNPRFP